jgi:ankyrin repeat protein
MGPCDIASLLGAVPSLVGLLTLRHATIEDDSFRTLLSYTAERGYGPVTRWLIELDSTRVEYEDCKGRTPLSYAAECGHLALAKMLLERGEAKADSQDWTGRTPLSHAGAAGRVPVVKMLLAGTTLTPARKTIMAGRRCRMRPRRGTRPWLGCFSITEAS